MHHRSPSVPSLDADSSFRRAAVQSEQLIWTFDRSWEGITLPHPDSMMRATRARLFGHAASAPHLPEQLAVLLGVGPKWMLRSAPYLARASVNNRLGAAAIRRNQHPLPRGAKRTRRRRSALMAIERRILGQHHPDPTTDPYWHRTPLRGSDYVDALAILNEPAAVEHWSEDWWFAWERLAGTSPVSITLVDDASFFERMPLSPDRFARVAVGDTLGRALAEQRLFSVDLSILDGIAAGDSFGWRKYLYAPIALFALSPDRSTLLPVAIQCGQVPSNETPVITPADGLAWSLAKLTYNSAESNYHGIVEHGAHCHITIGAMAIALRRSLAPWHPIRIALEPNIEYTIPIALATKNLFEPGGRTATLQSVTSSSCAELVRRAWKQFDWSADSGMSHFAARKVDDVDVLPTYPMRDDISLISPAIQQFVSAYVDLYYEDDASVAADPEVQDWVAELRSPEGANQPSVPDLTTRAALGRFVHDIIWRASPYHAVINYSIYDAMAFVPNMPTATYAPAPRLDVEYSNDDIVAMLPPLEDCAGMINDAVHVVGLRLNRLGHYRRGHFEDARVAPLTDAFARALDAIELQIHEQNTTRRHPYKMLLPSRVTASIHI